MGSDSTDIDTSVSAFSKRMRDAQASVQPLSPMGNGYSRPTQSDLERIVNGKEAEAADSAWDDPGELAVHALLHRAWCMEISRKGWNVESEIASVHIKSLRMAQAAIRLIPKREPIA